jgi:RNA polymerase sigma factor (sigma-70 family)
MLDSGFVNQSSQQRRTQPPDRSRIALDDPPSPTKWILTPESFNRLLLWLNRDRDLAGEKYEEIRSGLIRRFRQLGRPDCEELANKTFDRVAKKLPAVIDKYVGEPEPYVFSIAYNIYREDLRKPIMLSLANYNFSQSTLPNPDEVIEKDQLNDCLQECLRQLSESSRNLITLYYRGERWDKIRRRKELAELLGIKLTNLRLRAQRIRTTLKKCILDCMERSASEREVLM